MASYIVRRLLSVIPVMFIVATVVFTLIHLTPGNPAAIILGSQASPDDVQRLMEQMGLTKPLPVQYLNWIVGILHGDLGQSIFLRESVAAAIVQHFLPTAMLCLGSMFVATIVGIPSGTIAAIKKGRFIDQCVMFGSMIGMSTPAFWGAILLVLLFAETLHVLPAAGYAAPTLHIWNWLRFLILPSFIMGFVQAGLIARMTRGVMVEVLENDYIRTARSKGLKTGKVIVRHALKNAMVPILTVLGNVLVVFLAGDAAIETIFTVPGIGYMVYNAVLQRDYPVISGVTLVFGFLYVIVNLIIDLCYLIVDPRVRY
ncbi:ABC transporter permease [Alicyclobacillus macrosporangiidus]|uniref:ABC transporter permease n=1 Tax=Alicyclobacillus macrosporangiidus TaxID=392015 RepID=UPI000497ABC7|nr:ABC transporter permease [Alicyclobacillus macrosporangiidus]